MKYTPAALGWLSSNAQDWLCFAARSHVYKNVKIRNIAHGLDMRFPRKFL